MFSNQKSYKFWGSIEPIIIDTRFPLRNFFDCHVLGSESLDLTPLNLFVISLIILKRKVLETLFISHFSVMFLLWIDPTIDKW